VQPESLKWIEPAIEKVILHQKMWPDQKIFQAFFKSILKYSLSQKLSSHKVIFIFEYSWNSLVRRFSSTVWFSTINYKNWTKIRWDALTEVKIAENPSQVKFWVQISDQISASRISLLNWTYNIGQIALHIKYVTECLSENNRKSATSKVLSLDLLSMNTVHEESLN
jgi:hypothetical protein